MQTGAACLQLCSTAPCEAGYAGSAWWDVSSKVATCRVLCGQVAHRLSWLCVWQCGGRAAHNLCRCAGCMCTVSCLLGCQRMQQVWAPGSSRSSSSSAVAEGAYSSRPRLLGVEQQQQLLRAAAAQPYACHLGTGAFVAAVLTELNALVVFACSRSTCPSSQALSCGTSCQPCAASSLSAAAATAVTCWTRASSACALCQTVWPCTSQAQTCSRDQMGHTGPRAVRMPHLLQRWMSCCGGMLCRWCLCCLSWRTQCRCTHSRYGGASAGLLGIS